MMDSGPVRNMYSTLSNKFERYRISLAFIIRIIYASVYRFAFPRGPNQFLLLFLVYFYLFLFHRSSFNQTPPPWMRTASRAQDAGPWYCINVTLGSPDFIAQELVWSVASHSCVSF